MTREPFPAARIGLGLSAFAAGDDGIDTVALRRAIHTAEPAGMHSVWVPHGTTLPAATDPPEAALDPVVLLAWVAAASTTIRLGSAVIVLPLDHPYRLAQRLASLDELSDGRLIVGIGRGEDGPASRLYGATGRHATDRYTEDVRVLRNLLRGRRVHSSQPGWPEQGLALGAPPQRPGGPPVWLGGGSAPALRQAASLADGWIASGATDVSRFALQISRLRDASAATGRVNPLTVAKRLYVKVDDDRRAAERAMASWFGRTWGNEDLTRSAGAYGTADDCASAVTALLDAGADIVIVDPVDHVDGQVDRIVNDVLPLLASTDRRTR